jgi:hypothetical protein
LQNGHVQASLTARALSAILSTRYKDFFRGSLESLSQVETLDLCPAVCTSINVYWDYERSRREKRRGALPMKIKSEQVRILVRQGWQGGALPLSYNMFAVRGFLQLAINHISWSYFTGFFGDGDDFIVIGSLKSHDSQSASQD